MYSVPKLIDFPFISIEISGLSSISLMASKIILASPLNSFPNFPISGAQTSVSFSVPGTGTLNSLEDELPCADRS